MIAKEMNAMVQAMIGARKNTTVSAFLGVTSSLSSSFRPSVSDWITPKGPARFGPGRNCMRPITRRSNQITSRVLMIRKTRTSTALTNESHHGVSLKSATGLSMEASAGAMVSTPV